MTIFVKRNTFAKKPWFLRVSITRLLKTLWGKRKIAHNEQFLIFPQCFLPIWRTFGHFYQILKSRLQTLSFWKSPKFVFWERFKGQQAIILKT